MERSPVTPPLARTLLQFSFASQILCEFIQSMCWQCARTCLSKARLLSAKNNTRDYTAESFVQGMEWMLIVMFAIKTKPRWL